MIADFRRKGRQVLPPDGLKVFRTPPAENLHREARRGMELRLLE